MKKAIFPGTFDPLHFGHTDVLMPAAQTFDHVVWAIGNNPEKRTMFDLPTRLDMMRRTALELDLYNVRVESFDGLLVNAAQEYRCTHIVRSLRVGMDFDYEFPMTLVNRKLAPKIITVYFPAQQNHFHISSTLVRQLHTLGQDLTDYVPKAVLARMNQSRTSEKP